MTQATPTSIPLLHGRYRIEARLGSGRLAAVYRAYDERLQRKVLVHMLRKDLMSQEPLRQRFVEEAHISARRSHPSLLEIFDSGEVGGRPYIVTEYVEGRTLRELGALSLEEALLYIRQVAGAVAACQAAGVPHPPISSNNVILVEDGHVELLENWTLPAAEIALDNACYRAPERTQGGNLTPVSAVYALGLLLIEMLTGKRPITGDDPRAVAQAHLSAQIPPLSQIRPLLYIPSLEQLLRRATARRPEERPPDAATFGQELDRLRREITGETRRLPAPPVRPPSLRERLRRTTESIVAPRVTSPEPVAHSMAPARARAADPQTRRRPIAGIVILLTVFVVVACGTYYGASLIMDRLLDIELPRPSVSLPTLPGPQIQWPDWLTGVVSGGGEVLVVTGVPDEGLNLRNAPGLKTQVIALLPNGTRVRKLEGPRNVDDVPWLRVRARVGARELEGWLSANFVKPE